MDASSFSSAASPLFNYLISSHPTPSPSSLSSSSSIDSSEYFSDDSPVLTPTSTPPLRFSGVPFSWEHTPGVPKNKLLLQNRRNIKKDSMNLLPLPPPACRTSTSMCGDVRFRRNWFSSRKDPFVAAFVECSKGRDRGGGQLKTRSVVDRFGFVNLNVSCKKTCDVDYSHSAVYLPKPRRSSYGLITHHSLIPK